MNCKIINAFVFAAGAAIGSAVTWKILKDKYERMIQAEIESFKESYMACMDSITSSTDDDSDESDEERPEDDPRQIKWEDLEDLCDEDEDDEDADEEAEYQAYEADRAAYLALANTYKKGGPEEVEKDVVKPYVIAPYDFGELDGYSQIELTYYADDILEDDEYNIVNDRDRLIGAGSLFTFGEYEDDAVFVRNEYLRTDFQILKDYRTYAEARSAGPNKVDD